MASRLLPSSYAQKQAAIREDPVATPVQIYALARNAPLQAIRHPNCPPDLWWELAVTYPFGAIDSPLWQINTLAEPERWLLLAQQHGRSWVSQFARLLNARQLRLLGCDYARRTFPILARYYPGVPLQRAALSVAERSAYNDAPEIDLHEAHARSFYAYDQPGTPQLDSVCYAMRATTKATSTEVFDGQALAAVSYCAAIALGAEIAERYVAPQYVLGLVGEVVNSHYAPHILMQSEGHQAVAYRVQLEFAWQWHRMVAYFQGTAQPMEDPTLLPVAAPVVAPEDPKEEEVGAYEDDVDPEEVERFRGGHYEDLPADWLLFQQAGIGRQDAPSNLEEHKGRLRRLVIVTGLPYNEACRFYATLTRGCKDEASFRHALGVFKNKWTAREVSNEFPESFIGYERQGAFREGKAFVNLFYDKLTPPISRTMRQEAGLCLALLQDNPLRASEVGGQVYTVRLTRKAEKEYQSVSQEMKLRLTDLFAELATQPRARGTKKLEKDSTTLRQRVGDYRVLYLVDDSTAQVTITRIAHRREAY